MKRKFTLLLTMLLMLGAGSSWAESVKVFSKGFGTPATDGTYNTSMGVYNSSSSSNNLMTLMEFSEGALSSYSKLTITLTDFTYNSGNEGGRARVRFDAGSTEVATKNISAAGTYTFIFGTGSDNGTTFYISDVSKVTKISFGGASFDGGSGCKTTVLNTGVYLTHASQTGNSEGALEISDNTGVTTLNSLLAVGGVNVELNNNLTLSSMIGSSSAPYSGTFNGNGNKISINYTDLTEDFAAPFRYVKGATIENLKVDGTISSSGKNIAGIAGQLDGTTTINNCQSSVCITSTSDDTATESNSGGIAAISVANSSITITNCIYDGSITAKGNKAFCGIVGYLRTGVNTAKYNLVLGTISGFTSNYTTCNILRKADKDDDVDKNYYKTQWNGSDGTQVTDAELFSGEVAYNLQGSQDTQYWGQANLNKSNVKLPELTSDAAKKVVKLTIKNGGGYVVATAYANAGGALPSATVGGGLGYTTSASNWSTKISVSPNTDSDIYRFVGKYLLTVGTAGATTLVLPFNATLPSGVTAYNLTYTSGDEVTGKEVTSITANKPVLINADEGTYDFETENSSEITYTKDTPQQNGALNGIYTDTYYSVPANSYVLQDGERGLGFYKVAEDNKIKITSFRAYLTPQGEGGNSRAFFGIDFDDETTGIESVKDSGVKVQDSEAYYDLSGRRVVHPTKGLYIVNGKKVVIK